jgi:glycosyltransferase involved in cell wall biosynthesis
VSRAAIEGPFTGVAVLIPCHNEEATVGVVVSDFQQALPGASIYVYDNCSTDDTAAVARAAGAQVFSESRRGKGYVVQRMFADLEAEVYVLVDGDDTYDASAAPGMVKLLVQNRLDMVVGTREAVGDGGREYRRGHVFGNKMFSRGLRMMFGGDFTDALSGYRVFSRRFVRTFPALANGFDIESEITAHAASTGASWTEVPTFYRPRPEGSASKLHTVRDGARILRTMLRLHRDFRPLRTFGAIAAVLVLAGAIFSYPIVKDYIETGLVPRFPTLFTVIGVFVVAAICLTAGMVLDSVSRERAERNRLAYLQHRAPSPDCIGSKPSERSDDDDSSRP